MCLISEPMASATEILTSVDDVGESSTLSITPVASGQDASAGPYGETTSTVSTVGSASSVTIENKRIQSSSAYWTTLTTPSGKSRGRFTNSGWGTSARQQGPRAASSISVPPEERSGRSSTSLWGTSTTDPGQHTALSTSVQHERSSGGSTTSGWGTSTTHQDLRTTSSISAQPEETSTSKIALRGSSTYSAREISTVESDIKATTRATNDVASTFMAISSKTTHPGQWTSAGDDASTQTNEGTAAVVWSRAFTDPWVGPTTDHQSPSIRSETATTAMISQTTDGRGSACQGNAREYC